MGKPQPPTIDSNYGDNWDVLAIGQNDVKRSNNIISTIMAHFAGIGTMELQTVLSESCDIAA